MIAATIEKYSRMSNESTVSESILCYCVCQIEWYKVNGFFLLSIEIQEFIADVDACASACECK